MSTFNQGILGGFSGKTGSVIGASWKNKTVMRGLPKLKKNRKASQFQLDQQEKFRLMINFLSSFQELLGITYKRRSTGQTGINAALSYNLRNGITGTESPFGLNYEKLQFGYGNGILPNAGNPTVTAASGNTLDFEWSNNAGASKAKDTDKTILIVYCPELNQSLYFVDTALRSAEFSNVDSSLFAGKSVETWMLFISEDMNLVSATVYTGSVNLLP